MGFDYKYGDVTTERGDIPADEPVIVFRGRDSQVVPMLDDYLNRCAAAGSPQRHLNLVQESREKIRQWQRDHPDRVQVPQSRSMPELLEKESFE